jgi:P-aminobenzoate N-oxygenase AurF
MQTNTSRYAKSLENSRRIHWDIDKDVFRGREFDFADHFLPDGLSMISRLPFLGDADRRKLSQIQGRTYANIFGLVERFINAKVLELSRDHWLGDQTALEALVGFSQEELKHQEMFRRIEQMIGAGMPDGYVVVAHPDHVASAVLSKSTWAVLALTCHIELFTQVHYTESIQSDVTLSPLYKDVFLYHWKEESQHAILDELEWTRADQRMTPAERDQAVDDFIALVGAVDGILEAQSAADVNYFQSIAERRFDAQQIEQLQAGVLRAYRWQYIVSGAQHPRFLKLLLAMITPAQAERVTRALAPITESLQAK